MTANSMTMVFISGNGFQWAYHATGASGGDVGVYHGGAQVFMAEQLLHGANVGAAFQQVCGKGHYVTR